MNEHIFSTNPPFRGKQSSRSTSIVSKLDKYLLKMQDHMYTFLLKTYVVNLLQKLPHSIIVRCDLDIARKCM